MDEALLRHKIKSMNILFVHEVDWLEKVVFDIHFLAESLSLLGHQVYIIDYQDMAFFASSRITFKGISSLSAIFLQSSYSGEGVAVTPGISLCLTRMVPNLVSTRLVNLLSLQR